MWVFIINHIFIVFITYMRNYFRTVDIGNEGLIISIERKGQLFDGIKALIFLMLKIQPKVSATVRVSLLARQVTGNTAFAKAKLL